jgi:hypothetical protein
VFNSQEAEGKKAILQALSASQSGSMLVQENAIFVDEINSKTPSTNNAV